MASNIPQYVSDYEVEQITTEDAPKRKAKRDRTFISNVLIRNIYFHNLFL